MTAQRNRKKLRRRGRRAQARAGQRRRSFTPNTNIHPLKQLRLELLHRSRPQLFSNLKFHPNPRSQFPQLLPINIRLGTSSVHPLQFQSLSHHNRPSPSASGLNHHLLHTSCLAGRPIMAATSYSTDPTLFLYTSLTAGSSHIITATSRLETILKANKIPFRALDCATDEKARMLWGRRSKGRKLPGLVKYGNIIGVSADLSSELPPEANELVFRISNR